ncbi:MAG: acetyltransferase [Magnetococcales bacterium]|nr:acetyltransferase [Magnetococcales bacterium]
MKDVAIVGAGDIFDLVESSLSSDDYRIVGYFSYSKISKGIYQRYVYLGTTELITEVQYRETAFVIGVYDSQRRKYLQQVINGAWGDVLTVVHPSSVVYPTATIGPGSIVGPNAVISTCAQVGRGVYVNYGALVGHDVLLGDYSFISPGARVLGYAEVGEATLIGSNAVICSKVKVGRNVTIGAGCVVAHDVPDNTRVIIQQKLRFLSQEEWMFESD